MLRRELGRPAWARQTIAIGTAADCYQPIEGHYKLTRGAIAALADHANPASIVTKGPMIVRDTDVLQELARKADLTGCISVPCVDEDVWRELEPGTTARRSSGPT